MTEKNTDIYHLIDEEFISKFPAHHKPFMMSYYYNFYLQFCKSKNIKPLSKENFFKNMRRKKIKLVQICCPYCGKIQIIVIEEKLKKILDFSYCTTCGKKSVSENLFSQIGRYLRIYYVHSLALSELKKTYSEQEVKNLTYDIFHLEIMELTSILEVALRDFFISLVYIKFKNTRLNYISRLINKSTNNDFMNVDKANTHLKHALDINLKDLISSEDWETLKDLVETRNTLVHNNGIIDNRFRDSKSFDRLKDYVSGNLLFTDEKLIKKFYDSLTEIISALENYFNNEYQANIHKIISNYYFNLTSE